VTRAVAALAAALSVALLVPVTAAARVRGDTRPFALIGKPGFPARAYAGPNGRVYEGTYDNPSGDTMPSRVFEFTGSGTLLRSWVMRGQDLSGAHGVQAATMDHKGRLILLDKNPPRVVRLNRRTGAQALYARFPEGTVPNYAAWGRDGSLYVTDYESPKVWRVPRGGGKPKVWLTDPSLDGGPFGLTGIALAKDRRTLLIAQQSAAGLGAGNPSTGRISTVAIQPDGSPGPLTTLWESKPLDGPDGFAIARSGAIYIALLAANQIAVINPDGTEKERFGAALTGDNGGPVPFDAPSSASFLGTRLMVANQSYVTGDATHQAILDVETGEPGLREYVWKPRPKKRKRNR
jgi:sugar lactone lactonase YvrE